MLRGEKPRGTQFVVAIHTNRDKSGDKGKVAWITGEPPCFSCAIEKVYQFLEDWIKDEVVELPPIKVQTTTEEKASPFYCKYHKYKRHGHGGCWAFTRLFDKKLKA